MAEDHGTQHEMRISHEGGYVTVVLLLVMYFRCFNSFLRKITQSELMRQNDLKRKGEEFMGISI